MRKALTFAVAFLIAGSALAAGEIWRWKDSNGTWHYSDQPQAGAELVRRAGKPTTDSPAPAANPAAPAAAAAEPGLPPVSDAVAAQVRQDAATAKADQCKKAIEAYDKAVRARVFSKTDAAGKQTFMSDAEIDAARLQARSFRDLACGPGA